MTNLNSTMHKTIEIVRLGWPFGHGIDIFYREAGSKNAPPELIANYIRNFARSNAPKSSGRFVEEN
ncbi:hypothetical protein [Moorena sp. SIO3H5]|uniref:hypothetical protein n=1 Tax=Moorena sp. SIO3H5 TaxID=2607834 RepID=UPI0025D6D99B|nr:hypothetical protein [Moorena sp. SIO3H5]